MTAFMNGYSIENTIKQHVCKMYAHEKLIKANFLRAQLINM